MTIKYAYGYFEVIKYDDGNENEISAYDDLPELVPLNNTNNDEYDDLPELIPLNDTSNIEDDDEYADMPGLITPDEYTYDYTYGYSYFYNH
jgi:hypothetical protein